MIKVFISLLLVVLSPGFAVGKPNERSHIVTYPVAGTTAKAIYEDIKKQSPRIAPNATFAFTSMATKTVKKEKKSNSGCGYSRFETSVIYSFVVPKLTNGKGVSKPLATQWSGFAAYLLAHEEWHRDNWRGCFKQYDLAALELSAKDCKSLDKEREKLFTSIKRKCIAADEAYDVGFRKEVRNHPFVANALGEKPKTGGLFGKLKKK